MSDYVTKTNVLSALGRFKENTDNLYETKADANDLKNACEARDSALDKRITNLEQKAGDEIIVDYPSSTYGMDEVPANVAEYAKVVKLRGVTRGKNQQIANANKTATITPDGTQTYASTIISCGLTQGKKYLVCAEVNYIGSKTLRAFCQTGTGATYGTPAIDITTGKKFCAWTLVPQNTSVALVLGISNLQTSDNLTSGDKATYSDICVTDLTQYFSSDPLVDVSTLTISDIQTNYPELLIPSDYDAGSLVNTEYSGIKSVGVNIWDEEMESGYWRVSDGVAVPDANKLRCKNPIAISPSTAYYLKFPTGANIDFNYTFFDIEGNYISGGYSATNISVTTPANAYYMKFYMGNGYGTTYNHDIQICLNSYTDKTTYHPHMADTLSLLSPVELRSAGSVHEELDVESGKKTRPVGSVDLGTLSFSLISGYQKTWYSNSLSGVIKGASSNDTPVELSAEKYIVMAASPIGDGNVGYIAVSTGGSIYINTGSDTTPPSGLLNYQLATPLPDEQLTPVLDPFIQVEGGGTIRPIQSQTTEIDSSMTAEYLSLGA